MRDSKEQPKHKYAPRKIINNHHITNVINYRERLLQSRRVMELNSTREEKLNGQSETVCWI